MPKHNEDGHRLDDAIVTQHSKIRNKSGLSNLANQLQSARMGIFGWKGRFSDIGEFSLCSHRRLLLCCYNIIKRVITLLKRDIWNSYVDLSENEERKMCFIQMHRVRHTSCLPPPYWYRFEAELLWDVFPCAKFVTCQYKAN